MKTNSESTDLEKFCQKEWRVSDKEDYDAILAEKQKELDELLKTNPIKNGSVVLFQYTAKIIKPITIRSPLPSE